MAVDFFFEDIDKIEIDYNLITDWIIKVIEIETFQLGDVSIVFCSDEYLLKINMDYLNHNYYTDIITFDYCEDNIINGDLFISLETVKDNSKEFNAPYITEIQRVIIHGVLHLLGYKDKEGKEKEKMRAKENTYLSLL